MPLPAGGPERARALSNKPKPPKVDMSDRPIYTQLPDNPWPKRIGVGFLVAAATCAAAYRALGDTFPANVAIFDVSKDFSEVAAPQSSENTLVSNAEPAGP